MKNRTWWILSVALAGLCCADLRADDLFQLFWRGTYYTRNSTGHIVALSFSEQAVINQVAQSSGLDPNQLVFVYRPRKRDAAVVQNNGAFVASVMQMQGTYTDVNNPSSTVTVRHALISDSSQDTALGSFFGFELRTLSARGALLNDSLVGSVLYSRGDSGNVYSAHVSTGGRVVDTTNAP